MKLILGDCLGKLKDVPDRSIDLICIDPPYGSTPLHWDKIINFDMLWNNLDSKLIERGNVLIFGQEPFSSFVRMSNIINYKYDWYWEKERLTNVFQVKRRPGKTVETISVFGKSDSRYYPQKAVYVGKRVTNKIGKNARWSKTMAIDTEKTKPFEYIDTGERHPTQVLKFNRDNNRGALHPTQKPVVLLEYLIKTYTLEGETVLDCCMGSGSTGIACLNTKRNFIGIEKDEKYFEIAKKRIEGHINGSK